MQNNLSHSFGCCGCHWACFLFPTTAHSAEWSFTNGKQCKINKLPRSSVQQLMPVKSLFTIFCFVFSINLLLFLFCSVTLVESIPEGLVYLNSTPNPSIFESWLQLIELAKSSIDIASFYWSLNGNDVIPHPTAWQVCT